MKERTQFIKGLLYLNKVYFARALHISKLLVSSSEATPRVAIEPRDNKLRHSTQLHHIWFLLNESKTNIQIYHKYCEINMVIYQVNPQNGGQ